MERKFEKELHRKFNSRTITPSDDAWQRVNLQRNRKKKKPVFIYKVAAVLVLALGISWIVFNGRQAEATPSIVNTHTGAPAAKFATQPPVPPTDVVEPRTKPDRPGKPGQAHDAIRQATAQISERGKTASADVVPILRPVVYEQKAEQIAIAINDMIASGKAVNEDDLDAMIEKARLEIASGRGLSKPTDASALLREGESELDENFRSGIIENLFKQKRIRVAFGNN